MFRGAPGVPAQVFASVANAGIFAVEGVQGPKMAV